MKIFKYILLLSFLLFCTFCHKKESYSNEVELKKLEVLKDNCSKNLLTPEGLKNARILKNNAIKYKNTLYTGYAYRYIMFYYLNHENKDSALYAGQRAKEYFLKANNKEEILKTENSLVEWEVNYGNPEVALNKAKVLLKETQKLNDKHSEFWTNQLLARIYSILEKPDKALVISNKMLEIKEKNKLDLGPSTAFVFLEIADVANSNKKYKLSLQYCDSVKYYINKYPDNNNSALTILLNINLANNYIGLNQISNARSVINVLSSFYPDTLDATDDKFYYYTQVVFSDYYFKIKEYNKALKSINTALSKFDRVSDRHNYKEAETKKVFILEAMKEYKNAYELQNKVYSYNDSLSKKQSIQQLNNLYNFYENEKLKNRADKANLKMKNNYTILILLSFIFLLLLLIGIIITINYKKIKQKNKKIILQFRDLDKYEDETRKISKLLKKVPEEKQKSSLFEKIESYLDDNKLYLNPEITRESLAEKLGTNREYLTKAIQENTNSTFMEYINNKRLKYARQLLFHNELISIDNLYTFSGFSSKSTFYRLFKQKYDLSPKEFQKIVFQKNNEFLRSIDK